MSHYIYSIFVKRASRSPHEWFRRSRSKNTSKTHKNTVSHPLAERTEGISCQRRTSSFTVLRGVSVAVEPAGCAVCMVAELAAERCTSEVLGRLATNKLVLIAVPLLGVRVQATLLFVGSALLSRLTWMSHWNQSLLHLQRHPSWTSLAPCKCGTPHEPNRCCTLMQVQWHLS